MLKDTWTGYDSHNKIVEGYYGPITMSIPEWRTNVAKGYNTLLGDGGVISGGTLRTPFGGSRAVYSGSVYQNYR